MMLQSTDNKIILYIILFFFLVSINNRNLGRIDFFEIKNIKFTGHKIFDENELKNYKFINIFNLNKDLIKNQIYQNNKIETLEIFKKYPSELIINIKKTNFLANLNIEGKIYFIGTNHKFIQSDFIDPSLPTVFGKSSIEDFFRLYEYISNSDLKFTDIKYLYFYPSKRWDLEFKNGNILKLPFIITKNTLSHYFEISQSEKFKKKKIFDMRIKNQLIVNDS